MEAAAVALVSEVEHGVFPCIHKISVFLLTYSLHRWCSKTRWLEGARVGAVAVEDVGVQEELKLSLNLTGTLASSLQKPRRACWSPEISFLGSPPMAKSKLLSKALSPIPRSNIEYRTHSIASLLLVFSAVWTTFSSRLERKCCALVPQLVRVSAMLPISSDRFVSPVHPRYVQHVQLNLIRIPGRRCLRC